MTKQYARPQSLLIAARENALHDLNSLVLAGVRPTRPAYAVVTACKETEGRFPTVEESLVALRAALTPSEEERAMALRIAADLRMAGVSREEIARAMGVSPSQVSRLLSAYPEAAVNKAGDIVFDQDQGRWVTPDAATKTA